MKNTLNDIILGFSKFLSVSWGAIHETTSMLEHGDKNGLVSDWMQANWEILVETPLRELLGFENAFLEPYGEGADCNNNSSRVWLPEVSATHRIICHSRDGNHLKDLLTGDLINEPVIFQEIGGHNTY